MLSSQYTIQQNLQSGYAGIQLFEDINTSAGESVRVGEGAGKLSSGTGNAFVGYQAGEQNLQGSYDTFVGYQAGQLNENSDSVTLIGAFAGRQNTNGNDTVFVGFRAGEFNFNGNQNVGVGAYALRENNSGSSVTAVGWRAAERNLDGDYNTMIGAEAGQNNRSGNYNTMAGYQVGRAAFQGSENTFFGAYAGYSNEYGSDNCLIGFKAGLDVTNGNFNIAIGAYSLSSGRQNPNAPSDCNVVIGAFTNTSGSGNVVLGLNAGSNSIGDDNVLIGKDVALIYSGHKSVVVGANALLQGSGECNTMIGYNIAPNFMNGSNNIFIGTGVDAITNDVSYSIAIGTSNVNAHSHSIAIGDGLDNFKEETILIGFDISADADNSVLLGKSLNIQNAIVFKDPINYPNIATVATRANDLFGPTLINYCNLLISSTNVIYTVGGAGQYTSNIISSSGNPRKTTYTVSGSYDIITANGSFDYSYIHYASSLITNEYNELGIVIPAYNMIQIYVAHGYGISTIINSPISGNINSYNNLYKNTLSLQLDYYNTSNASYISNVVTNITDFNTSNTVYNIYLQKDIKTASNVSSPIMDTTWIMNGPLESTINFSTNTFTTSYVGEGISPSNIDNNNQRTRYLIDRQPSYGILNKNIFNRTYQQSIQANSSNLTNEIEYTTICEYAFIHSNTNITDQFSIFPYLEIHNNDTQSNIYGITKRENSNSLFEIKNDSSSSNIIIRNNIIFPVNTELQRYIFTSNDFIGIPHTLDDLTSIYIDSYDSTWFDLISPTNPFAYSNVTKREVYILQKTASSSYTPYLPIVGTLTDISANTIPFSISVSSIPSNLYDINTSYHIELNNTGYGGSNIISSVYNLPNIPINKLWVIKASSNSDLYVADTSIVNINQNIYRRINPFITSDSVNIVIQSNVYLQEINVSFSNTTNYIYHTVNQTGITTDPIITNTTLDLFKNTDIDIFPIVNTSNFYSSNFSIDVENNIKTLDNTNYSYSLFDLVGTYDHTYGYSNVWTFDYLSNIYPIDKQNVESGNGIITINYDEYSSNYIYTIDKTPLNDPVYINNSTIPRTIPNIEEPDISYTSNIVRNISNVIFLSQASNYVYQLVDQLQNSFYNYGLISTSSCILLYSSNITSNQSASNISNTKILIDSTYADSGMTHYSNITSNILQFNENRTSNAVLPISRAMMYKENGNYEYVSSNNFITVVSNVGYVSTWTQNQIDLGVLYMQLPSPSGSSFIDTFHTIKETTLNSTFRTNYRLYNSNTVYISSYVPSTSNITYSDRYLFAGKRAKGIYNIKPILNNLANNISISGFVASRINFVYLHSNVDVILLNDQLVQESSFDITSTVYMVRVNQNATMANIEMFFTNATSTISTNIFTLPIVFDDYPSTSIPRQGINFGISKNAKNILDPYMFYHSWSNLSSENLQFDITSTLAGANYEITSNNILLTDINKSFTYNDCLQNHITIKPLASNINETIIYDLINRQTSTVLYSALSYNISSYEFYAFPNTNQIYTGSNASITTILYGSNQVENVYSDVFATYINNYKDSDNEDVPINDISIYIETFPKKGILYNSINKQIPYQSFLNDKIRYLSYDPEDISHDTIEFRFIYKTFNISPKYSISLSNYAVPIINLPIQRGSNVPIEYFIRSSSKNIQRYLSDGNTFSSNYITVSALNGYPLTIEEVPINFYNKSGDILTTTTLQIEPYVLSAIPILSMDSITISANQYSISSLKPLLTTVNNSYTWNSIIDFVLTTPIISGSNLSTNHGVIMKKSYTNGILKLTPISHFTKEELMNDIIVYSHIGNGNSTDIGAYTDSFTCYATCGEYAYNRNKITVTINIYPLPYIQSISDDYVYYNTKQLASNTINLLNGSIKISTINATGTESLSVLSTSNITILNTLTNQIVNVFSINDLTNGYIGYKIHKTFLDNNNFEEDWPFQLRFSPNGLSNVISSNELVHIPQYSNLFIYNLRGTLNTFESSNTILYPQIENQHLNYAFSSSTVFESNPLDILFQLKPAFSLSTIGMTSTEYADSENLRNYEFDIKFGDTLYGSNIFHAKITDKSLTLYEPYSYNNENTADVIIYDDWNDISISSADATNNNNASILINSLVINLNVPLNTGNLKSITLFINEVSSSNFIDNIYNINTPNPYGGDIPITYLITNYASTLYLRNFEIDIRTFSFQENDYDPNVANVVIGRSIIVKGSDNIAIGKQFSSSGKNNIIIGNYIGVDANEPTLTNEIYESIIIGNNSFINSRIQNIIALGNSILNDLGNISPEKINEFIAQKPIIIGNSITSDYIDYNINIGNIFLKTDTINSQVYLGLNNEKVAIGYNENKGFSYYQDLYVAHGIAIGNNSNTSSNNYALDIAGDINITGILYQNGSPYAGSQWFTTGNDIYYDNGSVGIKTIPNNIYSLDVNGDINFSGNLYKNGALFSFWGDIVYGSGSNASNIWTHSSNIGVIVPSPGSISYVSTSNSIFRHSENNVEYAFDITFTITNSSGGIDDYKLILPAELDSSYYLTNSIIGSVWSCVSVGSLSNYFPVSIRNPITNQSNVIIRLINGTTESPFTMLPSGTTIQLFGMFTYVSTKIVPLISITETSWYKTEYGIYNSNNTNIGIGTTIPQYTLDVNGNINFTSNLYQRNTLIDLTAINIATSNINRINPWIPTKDPPTLILPTPGTISYLSSSNSIYRHVDNDVEYSFNVSTIITQASGVGDYKISLPVPFNSNYYTPNTIIGNIWSRVISGGLSNFIPISVSTLSGSESNFMAVRFINGTTETPMSILTSGTSLLLSGTIEYVTPVYPRSGIFLSNVCYQDDYGHIGFNTFGPLQGQVDIVGNESGRPALYVKNNFQDPIAIFEGSGNIGIGTNLPRAKLDVDGSIVTSSIGIGITNPTYQLQLSLDSAAKPISSTWSVSSDIRVKENIQNADIDRCYDVIKELRLCRFRWNSNYLPDVADKNMIGWIAQEVEPFIPNSIRKTSNYGFPDMYNLDSDQIIKFMYGAIQKNIMVIENQQTTIEKLSIELERLKQFISLKFDDFL